jgi:hypothetical protein
VIQHSIIEASNSEFNHRPHGQTRTFGSKFLLLSVLVCVVRGCFEFGITVAASNILKKPVYLFAYGFTVRQQVFVVFGQFCGGSIG